MSDPERDRRARIKRNAEEWIIYRAARAQPEGKPALLPEAKFRNWNEHRWAKLLAQSCAEAAFREAAASIYATAGGPYVGGYDDVSKAKDFRLVDPKHHMALVPVREFLIAHIPKYLGKKVVGAR